MASRKKKSPPDHYLYGVRKTPTGALSGKPTERSPYEELTLLLAQCLREKGGGTMPYVWRNAERFLTYRGVRICHAYKDEFSDLPLEFWYSTCACESPGSECEFDVRDLAGYNYETDGENPARHKEVVKAAIRAGLLQTDMPYTGKPVDETSNIPMG